jgi:hypothetical protein
MEMRALLFEPADRSSARTWLLACGVAVIAVLGGLLVRGAFGAGPSHPVGAAVPNAAELQFAESSRPGLRVLFIGNSFTAANSLPDMVRRLATVRTASGQVFAVQYDPAGSQLHDASTDPQLRGLLERVRWNVVVVQEQSQLPALPYWLQNSTLPALRILDAMIRGDGASPLLFETWGYQRGDLMNQPGDSFMAMQTRLHDGYDYLAQQESVPIAAVGDAWAQALSQRPSAPLWAADGKHPSTEGSYLAAVVIANAVLQQSSPAPGASTMNSGYTAGLDRNTATWLQRVGLAAAAQSSGSAL